MAKLRLSKRERAIVAIGIAVVLAAPLYFSVVRPLSAKYERSERYLEAAKGRLAQAQLICSEIALERGGQEALEQRIKDRPPRFDLWTTVNQARRELQLEDRAEMRRKRASLLASSGRLDEVELTLAGVSMSELIELLYKICEPGNLIFVYELESLQPAPDGKGLNCSITLITPKA